MFCSSHRPSLQFFGAGESISGELCWFVSLLIHMTLPSHATLANLQVHIPVMPHPMRKIAQSDDVIVVFLPLWVDDVSGNRSKQYNKHINIYACNSNLPGKLLQQEFFVRFVSTSQHASSPEQLAAILDMIKFVLHLNTNESHTHHSSDLQRPTLFDA
jgi:hypothetical protein